MVPHPSSLERKSPSPSHFDVCVIGHVTKDIISVGQTTTATTPGGTAYYTSVGLTKVGLRVAVVTKVAKEDEDLLLGNLKGEKIALFCKESRRSSVFENAYSTDNLDTRLQRIRSIGTPFSPEDVEAIPAKAFHVGPLTSQDISIDLLKKLAKRPGIVSLDAQGMLRSPHVGEVREEDWLDKEAGLAYVDILKTDEKEALILSGQKVSNKAAAVLASLGPKEVIVTMGSRGSLIYAEKTLHSVPCFFPKKVGYPTGCGDTYMAGYLYQKLKGVPPDLAGRFAAAMATLKMEGPGPFRGTEADVRALLSNI
jgi:sugar/nucleoside kinase (ribokinase family)